MQAPIVCPKVSRFMQLLACCAPESSNADYLSMLHPRSSSPHLQQATLLVRQQGAHSCSWYHKHKHQASCLALSEPQLNVYLVCLQPDHTACFSDLLSPNGLHYTQLPQHHVAAAPAPAGVYQQYHHQYQHPFQHQQLAPHPTAPAVIQQQVQVPYNGATVQHTAAGYGYQHNHHQQQQPNWPLYSQNQAIQLTYHSALCQRDMSERRLRPRNRGAAAAAGRRNRDDEDDDDYEVDDDADEPDSSDSADESSSSRRQVGTMGQVICWVQCLLPNFQVLPAATMIMVDRVIEHEGHQMEHGSLMIFQAK